MNFHELKGVALLIGYSPELTCVYSALMPTGDYWDGEHPWDATSGIKTLRLEKLHGYLFDESGGLMQEFESIFDLGSGSYKSGWARHADGTYQEDAA